MASRKKRATFTIRFVGEGVTPSAVPVRTLSDAASAVMRLAIGSDSEETSRVRVLDVKSGSAVYPCLIDEADDIESNLLIAGAISRDQNLDDLTAEMLSPIENLSAIARKFSDGRVEVFLGDVSVKEMKNVQPIASFNSRTYGLVRGTAVATDSTVVHGFLVGVGGATDNKCRLRIHDRSKLLYCDVFDEDLSRTLGQHLYEHVTLRGTGTFFSRTWDLIAMRVDELVGRGEGNIKDLLGNIRKAGDSAWGPVHDVESEIRSLR